MILICVATAFAGGCATHRGGANDNFEAPANNSEAYPDPAGSPTERPGMNPLDPRDPQHFTHPDPSQTPNNANP